MNFRRRRDEPPEINLIPFIDVLLVILIFLMLSTTYSRFTELRINLPIADTERAREYPKEIAVGVAADGRYSVDGSALASRDLATLTAALNLAAAGHSDRVVVVSADANAPHQSVITVLDAARRAHLPHLTFATQASRNGAAPAAGGGR